MKLTELMLEAREDFLLQQYGDKLAAAAKRERKQLDGAAVMQQLRSADPTRNGKYLQWIIGQYIGKMFRLEDAPRVREQLAQFAELARRKRLDQSDLNKYTYRTLVDALDAAVDGGGESKVMDIDTTGCHVMYNGPLGLLAVPQDEQAAIRLGKGTSWCTARDDSNNMYDNYADTGSLFVWIGSSKEKYQFYVKGVFFDRVEKTAGDHYLLDDESPYSFVYIVDSIASGEEEGASDSIQFMNRKDQPIPVDTMKKLRQHPALSKLFAYYDKAVMQIVDDSIADSYFERFGMSSPTKTNASARTIIKRVAMNIHGGIDRPLSKQEMDVVNKDPIASIALAIITHNRTKASDKIAASIQTKEPDVLGLYLDTFDISADDLVTDDSKNVKQMSAKQAYAKIVRSGGKATQQELDAIKTDPMWAADWAIQYSKKPWPEAEPYILQNTGVATRYACKLKRKWPELEQELLKRGTAFSKAQYAATLLGGKWPEAERSMVGPDLEQYHQIVKMLTSDAAART